ncbi:pre-mRNA-splicing factor SLU7 [Parasteatoda tepidariorum]|uniref:pre-mRNA-splicing factor SLU7 n=1 Tax=Parasteatoda tepidariorum TaxID=114398 RepID=UPI001C721E74|nr:pre-mRNA-splicing factor SLU7 isoform X1 [Parasteatoda tepidariorum]XP_042910213.1 pre-mRNA-splicing factor SLU7 isoform X2 [Parasteatoda tepidariorum]
MNSVSRPVSEILKNKDIDEPKKRSREDWRKAKELEEARKAGNAPAAVDEDGKDINPHLPQYISSAPWYFGAKTATLKHQRPQPDRQKDFSQISDEYVRGLKGSICVRYRPGACENCGAMTHTKKDCLERPRKVGAKYSQSDFAPDETVLPNLMLDYDGKRDRWSGYDPSNYHNIVEEFSKIEEAKRHLKEEKLKQDYLSDETNLAKEQTKDADIDDDDDEEKYADHADMPGTKVDSKQRITVRNLRIREDTAKYLRNLDPNSAYYDPKTRAMRDNPYKTTGKDATELAYAGDNFVRYTGDTSKHSQTQSFAWQAYEKGVEVNLLAEPTKAELLHQEFKVKKGEVKDNIKNSIIDTYGGEEYLEAPPKQLIFSQSEDYVEYSRQGNVIKGDEKPVIRSKYEEDVHINNHTAVFGSYWQDFQWGYKCCHSFIKNSYCTGLAGKEAFKEVSSISLLTEKLAKPVASNPEPAHNSEDSTQEDQIKKKKHKKDKKKKKKKKHHSSSSEDDSEAEKDKKLKKALKAEEESQQNADRLLAMDERKRPYNSMYEAKAPTEEEMEAYFIKRKRAEDPMVGFL